MKKEEDFIFGIHPVAEALKAGKEIDRLLLQKNINGEQFQDILRLARERHIPVQMVPDAKLNSIVRGNHQGIIAFILPISFAKLENVLMQCFESGKIPLIIVLDQITDVRNFGAIARTAECAGATAIIVPEKGSARIGADAVKASAGALLEIPVCRVRNLDGTIKYLQDSGLRVFSCTEKCEKRYSSADYSIPTAIILGSEEFGISVDLLKRSDEWIKIPMAGNISSLNVSVAAGIVLFEVLRQRQSI